MQRRVRAHHAVAEIPVNCADDFLADCGGQRVKRMPDNVVALVHSDNRGFALAVIPGNNAVIWHLATAARKKHGGVERYLITFNRDNLCAALKCVTVFMVKQFRLHGVRSFAYIFSLKNPSSNM